MKKFGLTDKEVAESKAKYGDNSMTEQAHESFWDKLKGNLGDPMIKILIVALLINVVLAVLGLVKNADGHPFVEGAPEWYEPLGIFIAICLATLVSTFSEYRNENAFQKLQEEASRIMVKTYRNGVISEVAINDIVVGDAILLQSGDKIPADGIIIDGDIKVDQSVLNGESREAKKFAIPEGWVDTDENTNFDSEYKVYRGAVVCSGNAVMQVTVVGDKSEYGKIASELQTEDDRETPLKVKLGKLANGISKFGYIGGVAIAVAMLAKTILFDTGFAPMAFLAPGGVFAWAALLKALIEAVMLAVIIIVMAVPEGLPLMIAIVSAQNMGKMLKDNVLVRKVAGIETAGSLNILFSDKTGTITKGKLEAINFLDGAVNEYKTFDDVGGKLGDLLSLSIHKNTLSMISGEGKERRVLGGNATERAILGYAMNTECKAVVKAVGNIPFNSTNKYSATQVEGEYDLSLIKGAPEKILQRCSHYYDKDGKKQPFDMNALNAKIDELANRAIRVLAVATSEDALGEESLPEGNNWTLVGCLGIRDEVRPESVTAIKEVKGAGVQVVMITGDRKETAVAIAKEAGLIDSDSNLMLTSDELAKMSDDDIKAKLKDIRVIARALPTDKSRLVRLAQELDLVAGMTGDGVNDSPALKKADVGFAMGGGTEVAKEASDIVILDDNFNSIDRAILYGRTIFNSIRKFIVFQLTINVAAVLVSFVCPLIGVANPLSVIQILWVNLVMDTLAALAFGGEPPLERFMKEKPKRRNEPIISKYMMSEIIVGAGWTFALSIAMLILGSFPSGDPVSYLESWGWLRDIHIENEPHAILHTAYFAFFIFIAVFNAFNARTDRMNLFDNLGKNKGFLTVFGIIAVVQILMTYLGRGILSGWGLNLVEWLVVLIPAISIIPIDLIRKAIANSAGKGN
ncbi:MAG: calcium-translocating P-type ATPase, PMCA-type [Lachnospiraceae bacterium]|nr:calcium-translocating P-type ATPase, PMCA-type [Ruminococcus sp.]MCM1273939.1 calcium-translocating P-type ATPase, PMCA-type [Lachnospiraceae bacterium]